VLRLHGREVDGVCTGWLLPAIETAWTVTGAMDCLRLSIIRSCRPNERTYVQDDVEAAPRRRAVRGVAAGLRRGYAVNPPAAPSSAPTTSCSCHSAAVATASSPCRCVAAFLLAWPASAVAAPPARGMHVSVSIALSSAPASALTRPPSVGREKIAPVESAKLATPPDLAKDGCRRRCRCHLRGGAATLRCRGRRRAALQSATWARGGATVVAASAAAQRPSGVEAAGTAHGDPPSLPATAAVSAPPPAARRFVVTAVGALRLWGCWFEMSKTYPRSFFDHKLL
jgi:hypothetical protein